MTLQGGVMSPVEAAWVQAHVWTDGMRRVESLAWPGFYTRCECQRTRCYQCDRGKHEQCSGMPRQAREGMIADKSGTGPACFRESYQHRTIDGPPLATVVAQVWLADRICRWACRCDCKGKRPMSPVEAAWVRARVWTDRQRADRQQHPDRYTLTACQPVASIPVPGGTQDALPGFNIVKGI
ncbi:DUF6248 family natural product biosynthesis protein [Streptosporangium sp. NPDC049248]|uniref:DUF6248 family natural product biosynthesis protein n=1 Tax=Streptosporangium sp. NPDC049248 TaxID=3155651 RepID=UPI00341C3ED6